MKIYHTETQEDYDALMVELERQGIGTLGKRYWEVYENQTAVIVHALCRRSDSARTDTAYGSLEWALQTYPTVPIQKYKAKVDDKMKFTKENVEKVIGRYIVEQNYFISDLKSDIFKLDDTPEKVVAPKYFDEWYKEIEAKYSNPDSAKTFALWKLCQQGFGCSFEDIRGKKIPYETDLGEWLFENKMLAIDAVLNGYTIAPEKLYYIPLPHLETSDGIQQVLSKRENGTNYFASRPNEKLKQRYTKEEIAQVPEIYKSYAKPIEEEEE